MFKKQNSLLLMIVLLFALFLSSGCLSGNTENPEVVIYTSVDQIYAEKILKEFEEKTGIKVKAAYDVEAAKTTGLVQRLIAEREMPRADVFWSGEIIQTIRLKEEGVLAPYHSLSADDIPETFCDPEGFWTGFAGRARIMIVNTELVSRENWPSSVYDLLDPKFPGSKIGMAMPVFGTTATHVAGLYAALGEKEGREFFEKIKEREISVLDGNSAVKDLVAKGELLFGLTDTDDACQAIKEGFPVEIIFPDQEKDGMGSFIIPNTVSLVADSPHPEEGKKLIDYLLSREVEGKLVEMGWSHFPVRSDLTQPPCLNTEGIHEMEIDYGKVYLELDRALSEMREIFVQ